MTLSLGAGVGAAEKGGDHALVEKRRDGRQLGGDWGEQRRPGAPEYLAPLDIDQSDQPTRLEGGVDVEDSAWLERGAVTTAALEHHTAIGIDGARELHFHDGQEPVAEVVADLHDAPPVGPWRRGRGAEEVLGVEDDGQPLRKRHGLVHRDL